MIQQYSLILLVYVQTTYQLTILNLKLERRINLHVHV